MSTAPRVTRGQRLRENGDRDLALAFAAADVSASEPESPPSEDYRPPKRRRPLARSITAVDHILSTQRTAQSISLAEMLVNERKCTQDAIEQSKRRSAADQQRMKRLNSEILILRDKLAAVDVVDQRVKKAVTAQKVAQGKYSRSKQQVCKLHAQLQSLQHKFEQARTVAKAALALAAQRTAVVQPCQPPPRSALDVAQAIAQRRAAAAAAATTATVNENLGSLAIDRAERAVLAQAARAEHCVATSHRGPHDAASNSTHQQSHEQAAPFLAAQRLVIADVCTQARPLCGTSVADAGVLASAEPRRSAASAQPGAPNTDKHTR